MGDVYADEKGKVIFQFDTLNYSEATSIRSISGEWDDTVSKGDMAISLSRLSVGYEIKNFSIQYLKRYDNYINYAEDTIQFLYLSENQFPLTSGEQYDLYIKARTSASHGLKIGYKLPVSNQLMVSGYFSLLSADKLSAGSLNGQVETISNSDYDFNFHSDMVFHDDPLYDRKTQSLSGDGYSVDLGISYTPNEYWKLNLDILDLTGELSFSKAPYTTADATSAVKQYDENGYVIYDPVIRGIEGYKKYSYEFDRQIHLSVLYTISERLELEIKHHNFRNIEYQEIFLNQAMGENILSWQLIPRLSALGLSFSNSVYTLGIASDSFNYKKMKYLSIQGGLYWEF
jgi:hypothetical protein